MEDNVTTITNKSMRKSQKRQIENNLELLGKAHDAIKKALETKNTEIALTLLEQAQDLAIQVGGMIEESLGEDFVTIGMLESYCEQIYQNYETIRQQQPLNSNKVYKNLRKELIRIENSVKNDIFVRTITVFLPYKASMWDSLESVWRAADADPDCDAFVIPIPYYDKNPDGSFKEEHYEGDQYPKDVPITRYDEFDLEACRPDVIYIHNPYDECNHVTSVHPYFYSKNLRNFTDKLVYIPYFVLREIEPDDQSSIDNMKHFCFTPGTVYADQVIVQSEKMRQIYINEYIKAAKEMGLFGEHVDRRFLEKKFLGTGSPKIDKVLNTRKEDLEIPPEWLKIIEKPDGSWKKIVFYNTSVSALLKHSEKMMQKMISVFETFKENKDEVALLWRPHPLIKATIESMCPQLWEAYKVIRDRYIEEGWGIYDDTADMDRAVVLSDAYYGDMSSVVQIAKMAGKAVLIQNVDKIESVEFENACLVSRGGAFDPENGVLWAVTSYTSTLLKIELATGIVMKYYQIPICQIKNYDFYTIRKVDSFLYLIPYNSDSLFRFSIEEEIFTEILLPLSDQEKRQAGKFRKAFFVGDVLYLIGYEVKLIIKMNVHTLEMERIEGFACSGQFLATDAVLINSDIYIPCCQENVIIHYKTTDDSWEEISVEKESKGFYTIVETDHGLSLTDLEDNKILFSIEDKKITVQKLCFMSQFQMQEIDHYQRYHSVFCFQDKEYYFPVYESTIWVRSQCESKELKYEFPKDSRAETRCYSKFDMLEREEDKIFFQAKTDGTIFIIDLNTDTVRKCVLQISTEQKHTLLGAAAKCKYREIASETDIYDLNSFILYSEKEENDL